MHDFETSVKLHYDELTEAEQEMTRYILNNRELVSQIGIVKLGTLLLSSKSSVLRLAKKLGFNGFSDMKHTLQHSPITPMLEPMDLMGDLKQGLSHMLNYSEQTNFQPFLSKLKNARMIYLFATGFSQNTSLPALMASIIATSLPASRSSFTTTLSNGCKPYIIQLFVS